MVQFSQNWLILQFHVSYCLLSFASPDYTTYFQILRIIFTIKNPKWLAFSQLRPIKILHSYLLTEHPPPLIDVLPKNELAICLELHPPPSTTRSYKVLYTRLGRSSTEVIHQCHLLSSVVVFSVGCLKHFGNRRRQHTIL